MRAKIMLLTANKRDEETAAWAEQVLIDLSAAFDHSFSLMRGKIGEGLTDETVEACQQCQAVFACDAGAEGVQDLYDALDLPLQIRCFSVPESLCGRHEAPVSMYVGTVLSLDEETVRRAMRAAFWFSQEQECRLCVIPPNGASKAEWEAAARVQEASQPQASSVTLSAPDAVAQMISAPERMGLALCPPYAGSILLSAGMALCSHPEIVHDAAFDEGCGVYAPYLVPEDETPLPFSSALAVAKLLRYSLRLPREAACVEAAVNNVLSSRDGDMDAKRALELICEQISVAGELMQRSGIG